MTQLLADLKTTTLCASVRHHSSTFRPQPTSSNQPPLPSTLSPRRSVAILTECWRTKSRKQLSMWRQRIMSGQSVLMATKRPTHQKPRPLVSKAFPLLRLSFGKFLSSCCEIAFPFFLCNFKASRTQSFTYIELIFFPIRIHPSLQTTCFSSATFEAKSE